MLKLPVHVQNAWALQSEAGAEAKAYTARTLKCLAANASLRQSVCDAALPGLAHVLKVAADLVVLTACVAFKDGTLTLMLLVPDGCTSS